MRGDAAAGVMIPATGSGRELVVLTISVWRVESDRAHTPRRCPALLAVADAAAGD